MKIRKVQGHHWRDWRWETTLIEARFEDFDAVKDSEFFDLLLVEAVNSGMGTINILPALIQGGAIIGDGRQRLAFPEKFIPFIFETLIGFPRLSFFGSCLELIFWIHLRNTTDYCFYPLRRTSRSQEKVLYQEEGSIYSSPSNGHWGLCRYPQEDRWHCS